jgi:AhpD family alkylhydroperoxidase
MPGSRVPLLSREEAPPLAREWYRADGGASSLLRSLAAAPDLLETLMPWLDQVMGESSIDLATKELVIVRVSQLCGCRYCLAAHTPVALAAGVSEEQVQAVCGQAPLASLPSRERAVVSWVDQVTQDAAGVTDELWAQTLEHVREDELIELTLLAGATRMLNQFCTALDLPPPTDA